jgi:hypothetical protein
LSQLASAIVSWAPLDVWLRLRRVWKHDPTTLAAGIDSLLIYLGAIDEWTSAAGGMHSQDQGKLSEEVMRLRKATVQWIIKSGSW